MPFCALKKKKQAIDCACSVCKLCARVNWLNSVTVHEVWFENKGKIIKYFSVSVWLSVNAYGIFFLL
jgi:hypothetical protein